jgi:hypothetical protein
VFWLKLFLGALFTKVICTVHLTSVQKDGFLMHHSIYSKKKSFFILEVWIKLHPYPDHKETHQNKKYKIFGRSKIGSSGFMSIINAQRPGVEKNQQGKIKAWKGTHF